MTRPSRCFETWIDARQAVELHRRPPRSSRRACDRTRSSTAAAARRRSVNVSEQAALHRVARVVEERAGAANDATTPGRRVTTGVTLMSRREPIAASAQPVTVASRSAQLRAAASFLRPEQVVQLVLELVDVAEVAVDRREPHERDLVELLAAPPSRRRRCPRSLISRSGFSCSAPRLSAIASSAATRTGRFSHALSRPATSFCRSNRSRRPSFLTTMYGISSMRS